MTTVTQPTVHAKRIGPTLIPDRSRVLMRPFYPSSDDIALRIVTRVLALSDEDIARLLSQMLGEFEDRHEQVEKFVRNRFAQVRQHLGEAWEPPAERQALTSRRSVPALSRRGTPPATAASGRSSCAT